MTLKPLKEKERKQDNERCVARIGWGQFRREHSLLILRVNDEVSQDPTDASPNRRLSCISTSTISYAEGVDHSSVFSNFKADPVSSTPSPQGIADLLMNRMTDRTSHILLYASRCEYLLEALRLDRGSDRERRVVVSYYGCTSLQCLRRTWKFGEDRGAYKQEQHEKSCVNQKEHGYL